MSGDGRYIAFSSDGRNLWPGDTNFARDVFVHDVTTGRIELVSISSTGELGNDTSINPVLSDDGRFVAFQSYANNFAEVDNNLYPDIYVHDRETGTTEIVSVDSNGQLADGGALYLDISSDGRYVAFSSLADGLVAGDTNLQQDVFVHDRQTGETDIVSVSTDGRFGNNDSRIPSISDDGRFVSFESTATNLVPQDTNAASDIFVSDRELGITRRVTTTSNGVEALSGGTPHAPGSFFASLSPDGRFVAFQSDAPNLMPGDDAARDFDVFVHDLLTGATIVGAYGLDGAAPDFGGGTPQLGRDGRLISFSSRSTNLVPEGNNEWNDIFVHDRGPSTGIGGIDVEIVGDQIQADGWASFAGDRIAYASDAADDADRGWELGGELTGVSVAARPELGDLFVRWELAHLPGVDTVAAGAPGVVHALAFQMGGTNYELRAARFDAARVPSFGLYSCDVACTEVAELDGGYGESGSEITMSVPLDTLGLEEGGSITGATAFAGIGHGAAGVLHRLDEIALGDFTLPRIEISFGLAPPGRDASDVVFDGPATLTNGRFTGAFPTLGHGGFELWARGCFGDVCGVAKTPIPVAQ